MHFKKRFVFIAFLIMAYLVPASAGAGDLAPAGNLDSGVYQTGDGNITAGAGTCIIRSGRDVVFAADGEIRLNPGFHAKEGSEFQGLISGTADLDEDGIKDWWEELYNLDDPGDDSDGDGLSNLEEFNKKTDPTAYNPPDISAFSANPASIAEGQSTTLSWDVTLADSLILTPGNDNLDINDTGFTVKPSATTLYTLTATGQGGTSFMTVEVGVTDPLPVISFIAIPDTIVEGSSAELRWSVSGAATISIDPVPAPAPGPGHFVSQVEVSPPATRTYTLTAANAQGKSSTATATITVQHHKPIVSISANPIVVPTGQTTTLTWQSAYAVSVSIDNGIGSVADSGSKEVNPSGSTIYTITATGADGQTTQASVWVSDATDTDGDGIPDVWEQANGLDDRNAADGSLDSDGDLTSNAREYQNGTNMFDYDHYDLEITGDITQDQFSGGNIIVNPLSDGTNNQAASIAASQDLTLQANCEIRINPETTIRTTNDTAVIKIRGGDCDMLPDDWELQYLNTLAYGIDDDPDNDGLNNYEEYRIHSDPLVYGYDNDGDGLKDRWELDNFGNLAQDAGGDYDNDGVDNLAEQIIKTNPVDAADYPLPGNYYEYDAVGRIKRIIRIN